MAKTYSTSGFGEKFSGKVKPIINPDGSFNVTKIGASPRSIYQHLISYSWPRFLLLALSGYLTVNFIFALIYVAVGVEHLSGIPQGSTGQNLLYCFFFSVQTLTTVGYGQIAPMGIATNIVATTEAIVGLMGFALITGLLYGRFSRPTARIRFSKNILLVAEPAQPELHFQLVNMRKDVLLHPEIQVIVKFNESTEQGVVRRFYNLNLRIHRIVFFPLNWRVVHEINEGSPLFGLSHEDIVQREVEFLILAHAFDPVFQQQVYTWHSYHAAQLLKNARFTTPYHIDESGHTVLPINNIDLVEMLD